MVFAGFFLGVGLLPRLKGGDYRAWALIVAAVFLAVALVAPRVLAWPNRAWQKFGELLHRVTSPLALAAIYILGVVPVGLALRLAGKDAMRRRRGPDLATYWIPREPPARADARMKLQF